MTKSNAILVGGLAVGASVGAVAYLTGLNLPLSIACCFITASAINILSVR